MEIAADKDGNIFSEELKLTFSSRTPGWLRVIDPRTGKVVPRYEEMDTALDSQTAARRAAENAAAKETAARRAAEAEVARLKAELDKLKK